MYETGTSTRKVQRIAERMGIVRLSKDQVSSAARSLDADVEELLARPLGGLAMPYIWLGATYLKCRREEHVSSTAIVTAIGCDADGWRHILGLAVVDTESYSSWKEFLERIRSRGVEGIQLVTSDAHEGLRQAISEVFLGAAWQRCAVHLMRNCMATAGSRSLKKRVAMIVKPVFRAKEADQVRALPPCGRDTRGMLPQGGGDLGGDGGRCSTEGAWVWQPRHEKISARPYLVPGTTPSLHPCSRCLQRHR
jgi:putative transposase